MNKTLKMSLGGLAIGDVDVLAGDNVPEDLERDVENPLSVKTVNGKLMLRYRSNQQAMRRDAKELPEIDLGAIVAAAAIIFTPPIATTAPSLSLILLLNDEAARPAANEALQIALVDPARDGRDDAAHLADAQKQNVLLNVGQESVFDVQPVADFAVDLRGLVDALLKSGTEYDLNLPLRFDELDDIELKISDNLSLAEDGLIYFRDVLNGEHDLVISQQDAFNNLRFVVTLTGGSFYLLEDDEEFAAPSLVDTLQADSAEQTNVLRIEEAEFEAVLSRAVIIPEFGAEIVYVDLEVFSLDTLILHGRLEVDMDVFDDYASETVDTNAGLPDDGDFAVGADSGFGAPNGQASPSDLGDDDLDDYTLDIL